MIYLYVQCAVFGTDEFRFIVLPMELHTDGFVAGKLCEQQERWKSNFKLDERRIAKPMNCEKNPKIDGFLISNIILWF